MRKLKSAPSSSSFAMGYLLVAVTIWSCSYGFVKQYLTGIDPYFAASLRLLLATGFFLPWLRLKGLEAPTVLRLMLIGAIQYGAMYCLYLEAVHYLNAYEVALFTLFVPLYINLVNDLYARRLHVVHWLMTLLGLAGAMVIEYRTPVWEHLRTGFLLMQGANLLFAWGMVDYRALRKNHPMLQDHRIYAIAFFGASVAAAFATTCVGAWSDWELLTITTWKALIYLSIVATGIGFFAWNKGCTMANPGTTAVISLLKVPCGVIASLLFFGERTDIPRLVIGLGIVILAIALSEWASRREVA